MFKYILSSLLLLLLISPAKADERTCLVEAVYFEARSETLIGKLAVANVILERMYNKSFPNTICGVVKQGMYWEGKPVRNKCQFSWYCDGKSDKPKEQEAWNNALEIAGLILYAEDKLVDFTEGATHYHATHILPHWAAHLIKVGRIEDHIFYRWEL